VPCFGCGIPLFPWEEVLCAGCQFEAFYRRALHIEVKEQDMSEQAPDSQDPRKLPNAAAKLAWVQGEVQPPGKGGWNAFHKFHYIEEKDVFHAIKALCARVGLAIVISTSDEIQTIRVENEKNKTENLVTIKGSIAVIDGASNTQVGPVFFGGQGMDPRDKALFKAQTGLVKYMLQKFFTVESEAVEDTDAHHSQEQPTTQGAAPAQAAKSDVPFDEAIGAERATTLQGLLVTAIEAGQLDANKLKAKLATLGSSWDLMAQMTEPVADQLWSWASSQAEQPVADQPPGSGVPA
jgi:hypothetical protein